MLILDSQPARGARGGLPIVKAAVLFQSRRDQVIRCGGSALSADSPSMPPEGPWFSAAHMAAVGAPDPAQHVRTRP